VAAVKGLFRSGMMEKWNAEVKKDKKNYLPFLIMLLTQKKILKSYHKVF